MPTDNTLYDRTGDIWWDQCVIRAKTDGRFGPGRTRKTADAVQLKRLKLYSDFG